MKKLNLSLIIALLRSQLILWESKTTWSVRFILFGILSLITAQMMGLLKQLPDNYLDIMAQIIFEPWGWLAVFIIVSMGAIPKSSSEVTLKISTIVGKREDGGYSACPS